MMEKLKQETWDEIRALGVETAENIDVATEFENKHEYDRGAEVDVEITRQGEEHSRLLAKVFEIDAILQSRKNE